jgi:hypothetical protein
MWLLRFWRRKFRLVEAMMTNRQASAVQQSERTRYRRTRIVMRPCLPLRVGAAAGPRRPAAKCDSSDAARLAPTPYRLHWPTHNVISDTNWTNFEYYGETRAAGARPLGVALYTSATYLAAGSPTRRCCGSLSPPSYTCSVYTAPYTPYTRTLVYRAALVERFTRPWESTA